MKKIIALALIAFFMAGGIALAGPPLNYSGDVMGQNKYLGDAHRVFRLVHISDAENDTDGIASGSVVVWSKTLYDGVSVALTTVSGDNKVAGILVGAVVSNDAIRNPTGGTALVSTATEDAGMTANWGWLQTYGKSAVNVTASVNGVTADALIVSSKQSATVESYQANSYPYASNPRNQGILGFSFATIAASGTSDDVFIRCE